VLDGRWAEYVDAVRGRKRLLGTMLDHARPLLLEAGELVLGFARGDIYVQSIAPERAALEELLSEVSGQKLRVKVVELRPDEEARFGSLAQTNERAEKDAKVARLKAGREHEGILRVVARLGAEIEDVRDLGGAEA
jgi:hypothetical protein